MSRAGDEHSGSHWQQRATQLAAELPPADAWRKLAAEICQADVPFSMHAGLWRIATRQWSEVDGPRPMWFPAADALTTAHVGRWMRELQLDSFQQLHQWSLAERDKFWQKVIDELEVVFRQQPETIVDMSRGASHARWLPGGRWNIVDSCFQPPADKTAIVFQQSATEDLQTWTFGELRSMVNRVSHGLQNLGMKAGDPVAVLLPMTPEAVAIYLGIIQVGCVAVSIADSFAPPEIQRRLEIAAAKLVFTVQCLKRAGKQIDVYGRLRGIDAPPAVVIEDAATPLNARHGDVPWQQFLGASESLAAVAGTNETPINILFSSGTTGDPKAIPWTQLTPLRCAADARLHQDLHPGDVAVWPTNLGWMMGPWLIFAALLNRATIGIYLDSPMERGFGQFVERSRAALLGVVPTIVKSWRRAGTMEGLDWSGIRAFSSTGEASTPDDMFYLSYLAGYRPVIEYCGGTEIGGGYISSTVVQPNAPSIFTTPTLGLDIEILNDQGLPDDQGELFLVPPSIGLSDQLLNRDHDATYYAHVPQLGDGRRLRRHGDYFQRLAGGHYVAGGRTDDTMNLGGIKVSSVEIERVLNQDPAIKETAAVADSSQGPDRLVVFAVLADNSDPPRELLQQSLNQRLKESLNPLFKIQRLVTIEQLPRTASNKIIRRQLRP